MPPAAAPASEFDDCEDPDRFSVARMREARSDTEAIAGLAHWLGVEASDLASCLRWHAGTRYHDQWLPKRSGGHRHLLVPHTVLRRLQRRVAEVLATRLPVHPAAHGFVLGRSTCTNAERHLGHGPVLNIDIRDFFGSITPDHLWPTLTAALPELTEPMRLQLLDLVMTAPDKPWLPAESLTAWAGRCLARAVERSTLHGRWRHALDTFDQIAAHPDAAPEAVGTWVLQRLQAGTPDDAALARRVGRVVIRLSSKRFNGVARVFRFLALRRWLAMPDQPFAGGIARMVREGLREAKLPVPPRLSEVWVQEQHRALGLGLTLPDRRRGRELRDAPVLALPQGAPTSPLLSNVAMYELDTQLSEFAAKHDMVYTRYADDLTWSGAKVTRCLVPELARRLDGFGFRLAQDKTQFMPKSTRQLVTGVVVNDKRSLPRPWRKRLRAALFEAGRREDLPPQLSGALAYAEMVSPNQAATLFEALRAGRSWAAMNPDWQPTERSRVTTPALTPARKRPAPPPAR